MEEEGSRGNNNSSFCGASRKSSAAAAAAPLSTSSAGPSSPSAGRPPSLLSSSSSSSSAPAASSSSSSSPSCAGAPSSSSSSCPPSSSAAQQQQDNGGCSPCAALLRHVLSQPGSLPSRLLGSLMAAGAAGAAGAPKEAALLPPEPLVARPIAGGLQVRIPADDQARARNGWRDLAASAAPLGEESTGGGARGKEEARLGGGGANKGSPLPLPLPLPKPSEATLSAAVRQHSLATSPSQPASSAVAAIESAADGASPAPRYEWLTLECRPCGDRGPEGGARAYVMGPSPLSVVVCQNRLVHTPLAPPTLAQDGTSGKDGGAGASASSSSAAPPPLRREQVEEMDEILSHELSHVYDVRNLLLDLRSCENLAYSEVRAARVAECRTRRAEEATTATPPSRRGPSPSGGESCDRETGSGSPRSAPGRGLWYPTFPSLSSLSSSASPWSSSRHPGGDEAEHRRRQQRSCVRHKAETATQNMFPHQARQCLDAVFEAAMADARPGILAAARPPPPPPRAGAPRGEPQSVGSSSAAAPVAPPPCAEAAAAPSAVSGPANPPRPPSPAGAAPSPLSSPSHNSSPPPSAR